MKTKLYFLLSVLVLGGLLSACTPSSITVQPQPYQRTITVTGSGMITLTPDIAYIYIGVQTNDASATVAMEQNNTQAQAVIAAIKAFGVEAKDIQTTNFSIYAQPIYDANYNEIGTTYAVSNTVYVTMRDLGKVGDLLDAAVQSGANTINSISFDVADKTAAVSQARLAAVEDARRQADELTAATDVSLGEVQSISYYDSNPTPIYYDLRAASDAAGAGSVPVQSGSMQVTTTVTIVYELK
jgi:uncharacterized protein YggE